MERRKTDANRRGGWRCDGDRKKNLRQGERDEEKKENDE